MVVGLFQLEFSFVLTIRARWASKIFIKWAFGLLCLFYYNVRCLDI